MCHDLDSRSCLKGQGHSWHIILKTFFWAITCQFQVGFWLYFTHVLSMTQSCVMILTQGHFSYFKVTVHMYPKSMSGPWLLPAMSDLDDISRNCCSGPKGVPWSWLKVIFPRSSPQCTYTDNLCPGHNSSLQSCSWIIVHTLIVHAQGCVRTLTEVHISNVNVPVHTYPKSCPGHNSSLPLKLDPFKGHNRL